MPFTAMLLTKILVCFQLLNYYSGAAYPLLPTKSLVKRAEIGCSSKSAHIANEEKAASELGKLPYKTSSQLASENGDSAGIIETESEDYLEGKLKIMGGVNSNKGQRGPFLCFDTISENLKNTFLCGKADGKNFDHLVASEKVEQADINTIQASKVFSGDVIPKEDSSPSEMFRDFEKERNDLNKLACLEDRIRSEHLQLWTDSYKINDASHGERIIKLENEYNEIKQLQLKTPQEISAFLENARNQPKTGAWIKRYRYLFNSDKTSSH